MGIFKYLLDLVNLCHIDLKCKHFFRPIWQKFTKVMFIGQFIWFTIIDYQHLNMPTFYIDNLSSYVIFILKDVPYFVLTLIIVSDTRSLLLIQHSVLLMSTSRNCRVWFLFPWILVSDLNYCYEVWVKLQWKEYLSLTIFH